MTLLRSYDDSIAILALETIKALAVIPLTHRGFNYNQHVTTLHKTSSHCAPLFQIVEATNWSFPVIAKEFLTQDFTVTDKHLVLEFDISQKPKVI
jgi:pyruvate-formate lyase